MPPSWNKIHLEKAEDCLWCASAPWPEDATAKLLGPVVSTLQPREGVQSVLAESGKDTPVPLRSSSAA